MSPLTSFGRHDRFCRGFFCAKACYPDQRFGTETALPCANALCKNCKKLRFLRLYAGVLWRNLVLALVKQGKLYFLQSRQTSRERGAFASENSCFISSRVQKPKNSAKQNSWIVCWFPPWNVFPPMKPAFFFPNSA